MLLRESFYGILKKDSTEAGLSSGDVGLVTCFRQEQRHGKSSGTMWSVVDVLLL